MRDFKSGKRNRSFSPSRSGGPSRRFGPPAGRGGSGRRSGFDREDRQEGSYERHERSERPRLEMHDVICAKCGKQCQVPFQPTRDKPVYCSDCFRKDTSAGSKFTPRGEGPPSSGISQQQYNELNQKLDKILEILSQVEFEPIEDEEEPEDESSN